MSEWMVQVEAPQAALYTVLDKPVQWESGLKIHAGWQLKVDSLIQEVSQICATAPLCHRHLCS